MADSHDRRTFLAAAAAGTAASVAGCSGSGEETDTTPTELQTTEVPTTAEPSAQVMAAVRPDRSEIRAVEEELKARVRNGSINRSQAQQEYRQRQTELLAESAESLRQRVADSELTIDDEKPDSGAFLVSGPSAALVDLLTADEVDALLSAAEFESV